MSDSDNPYPDVDPNLRFPELEERILKSWEADQTFQASVDQREGGDNEYVFYDGPPFANGLPHYGHLLTGYVKDVVPRYQTMRGRRVERRFGWDCHGLPAELEAEKELGVAGRQAIEALGIDTFNQACEASVQKYAGEWRSYVTRQARWVDFDNDYKTMDTSYMESVMWAFKQLYDKGLIYEGFRVMPYSWAVETPLSNFEIRMDNSYRSRQDPAVTVSFELEPVDGDPAPLSILIWTTTPWTLPSNLAMAVGEDIDYAIMKAADGRHLVIGAATRGSYEKELEGYEEVGMLKGAALVGRRYKPIFPYFENHENAFRILAADFVDTGEGTGTVHMAPGFGEDDQAVCAANGISIVCPVDEKGRYTSEVKDWEGINVLEANKPIIKDLKDRGVLFRHVTYEHNYPHCWRTDEPLIYKAVSSWYVEVTKFRDRMVELNQQIDWIPSHIRDGQFGKWLENARDWSISRNRYWGSPIPIWKSDDPAYPRTDVYGSIAELERDFGVEVPNLHRPFIDNLTRPNPDDPSGKSMMRRVPEVLDCWFESGSMPYAQVHYPFENKEWFESHFPADFIVEYVAQTRGWFYTLVVLSTALFDRPPFKSVICHGVVLDQDGQKLSKRLRNYPDPEEMFATHGSDALRWSLMSSPILRGGDLQIDLDGRSIAEIVRLVMKPIWNAYYFFTLYANTDGVTAKFRTNSDQLLDRYILAKTHQLVVDVQGDLDSYDLAGSCQRVTSFLEALNNWYIRRSRDRFWKQEKDQDKQDAYDTLFSVLTTLCRTAAPLLPLLTEEVYRGLTGERSVHLVDWPEASSLPADPDLVADMDRARDACSVALGLRESHKLRTRLPLASLTVAGSGSDRLGSFAHLITDEINVKELKFSDAIEQFGTFQLQVNAKVMGPKLGASMKSVMIASKKGEWTKSDDGTVEVGGVTLEPGEYGLRLQAKEGVASESLSTNDAVVVLDIEVTPALESEGLARDFVRLVQTARKAADLHVSDHIRLHADLPGSAIDSIEEHQAYIKDQTLTDDLVIGAVDTDMYVETAKLAGEDFQLGVKGI
jgi:isoleucyl-tRNA synthetase